MKNLAEVSGIARAPYMGGGGKKDGGLRWVTRKSTSGGGP